MNKRIVIAIACLLFSIGISFGKSLVLTLANNTLVYYMLGGAKNPMMRFVDSKVCVESDEYTFSNIKNFYISETDDPSGIEHLLKEQQITYKAGTLIVHTDNPESISVYTVNGMKISVPVEQAGNVVAVSMTQLPNGVYVVRVGESSFKVLKQ
ncbi:MAG: T9SS type A sorting domain-containing protein [Prevotella sp.]|nr:T9SS type A sorting domain-containing protein [Prevotella sp.]